MMRNSWDPILLCLFTLLLVPRGLAAQDAGRPVDRSLVLEEFGVSADGDLLIVPVSFDKKNYLFAVDTGCTVTVYDKSLKSLLGEMQSSESVDTTNGSVLVEAYRSPEAYLGKLGLKTQGSVVCHDLELIREGAGREIYGIIGMDFLRQHVVHLDSDQGKLSFLKALPPDPGTPVLITYRDELPRVTGTLPGLGPQDFLVDMGGISSALRRDVFDSLLARGTAKELKKALCRDLGRDAVCRQLAVKSTEIRYFQHRDLIFKESSGSEGSLLGLNFLERYNITFDFPHHLMYVKPSKKFDAADLFDLSGLYMLGVEGRVVIERVDDDSPAKMAGILAKDVVVKIDGQDVAPPQVHALRRRLCEWGKTVQLTVRRDDRLLEVSLGLPKPVAVQKIPEGPKRGHVEVATRKGGADVPVKPSASDRD
jgi:PDZ domain/Aspartyl protease